MDSSHQLKVNTVFSIRQHRRIGAPRKPGSASAPRWLGLLSLCAAMVWIYATWFPIYHWLNHNLMMFGLQVSVETGAIDLSDLFPPPPSELAAPAPPAGTESEKHDLTNAEPNEVRRNRNAQAPDEDGQSALAGGQATAERLVWVSYTWLVITTMIAFWLAACGGAAYTAPGTRPVGATRPALDRTLLVILLVAVVAIDLWFWGYWARCELPDWVAPWVDTKPTSAAKIALAGGVLLFSILLCRHISRPQAAIGAGILALLVVAITVYSLEVVRIQIPDIAIWTCVMALYVFASLVGVILHRYARALHDIAVGFVLLACLVTLAGMAYAEKLGGFVEKPPQAMTYARIMLGQAAYAGVILVARVSRR
jgi:hypothetical protein